MTHGKMKFHLDHRVVSQVAGINSKKMYWVIICASIYGILSTWPSATIIYFQFLKSSSNKNGFYYYIKVKIYILQGLAVNSLGSICCRIGIRIWAGFELSSLNETMLTFSHYFTRDLLNHVKHCFACDRWWLCLCAVCIRWTYNNPLCCVGFPNAPSALKSQPINDMHYGYTPALYGEPRML